MAHVTSADGTSIGYDRLSDGGPTVVLVGGGLDDGSENTPLGEWLAGTFTVVNYRRRGRGDSAAFIAAIGGRAHVFGASSGGALASEAAAAGLPIDRRSRRRRCGLPPERPAGDHGPVLADFYRA